MTTHESGASGTATSIDRGFVWDTLHYGNRRQIRDVIRLLKQRLRKAPDDLDLLLDLSRAYHSLEDPAKALEVAEKAFRLAPRNVEAATDYASSLIFARRYEDALNAAEVTEGLLRSLPTEEANARPGRGAPGRLDHIRWAALDGLGQHEAALAVARAGYISSSRSDMQYELERSLVATDNLTEAEELEEWRGDSLLGIGCHAMYLGKYGVACQYFARRLAFSRQPSEFVYMRHYIEALFAVGQHDEVASVTEYWLSTAGRLPMRDRLSLWVLRATVYALKKQPDDAVLYARSHISEAHRRRLFRMLERLYIYEATISAVRAALQPLGISDL